MKTMISMGLLLAMAGWQGGSRAQVAVLGDRQPQCVFSGRRAVSLLLTNAGSVAAELTVQLRLLQCTSATAVPLGVFPWKTLSLLPAQTVVESAPVDFPAVRAGTRFLIQWLEGTNRVLGHTDVLVYPPDLLKALKPLAGDEPLGVFDPAVLIKPLLRAAGVEFSDLEDAGWEGYAGKLVLAGPFPDRMGNTLGDRIQTVAHKGVAVVWIQPPSDPGAPLQPSFFTLSQGKGAVVVVQPELVASLADRPASQLHLLEFARLALHPEPLRLPHLTP